MLRSIFKFVVETRRKVSKTRWSRRYYYSAGIFTALHVACDEHRSQPTLPNVDTKECLKHAALASVNSASILLTTTFYLIDKVSERYKSLLSSLLRIMDDCILLDGWNEELWEDVIAIRQEVDTVKSELTFLMGHMAIVDKIVVATTEETFNLEANYLSTNLCEQSYSVQEKLKKLEQEISEIEKLYLLAQTQVAKYRIEDKN